MASQVKKLETNIYIKASAEQFHEVVCSRPHHTSNICPDKVHGVEINEGEWGTEGSIIYCNYALDGKACVAKDLVEAIDRENNKITLKVLEGDVLEHYKSFRAIIHVTPQKEGSMVHWTLEYEKLNENIPDPHPLLQWATEFCKDVDAHLITQDQK